MALHLSLRPGERVILGGAVVRNGSARTRLVVENEVPILRESDILRPGSVRTPCERVYLAIQLAYVDPGQAPQHLATYRALAEEVLEAAPSGREWITVMDAQVEAGELYRALKSARALISWEKERLEHVA